MYSSLLDWRKSLFSFSSGGELSLIPDLSLRVMGIFWHGRPDSSASLLVTYTEGMIFPLLPFFCSPDEIDPLSKPARFLDSAVFLPSPLLSKMTHPVVSLLLFAFVGIPVCLSAEGLS